MNAVAWSLKILWKKVIHQWPIRYYVLYEARCINKPDLAIVTIFYGVHSLYTLAMSFCLLCWFLCNFYWSISSPSCILACSWIVQSLGCRWWKNSLPSNHCLTIFLSFLTSLIVSTIDILMFMPYLLTHHTTNNNNWALMWPCLHYKYGLWPKYAQKCSFYDFGPIDDPNTGLCLPVPLHLLYLIFHITGLAPCPYHDYMLNTSNKAKLCQYWSKPS